MGWRETAYKVMTVRLLNSKSGCQETMDEIFKVLKDKDVQPAILYPVKLSVGHDG